MAGSNGSMAPDKSRVDRAAIAAMPLFQVVRKNGYVLWTGYSHNSAVLKCLELQSVAGLEDCRVAGIAEAGTVLA